jgi:hypothetical protein
MIVFFCCFLPPPHDFDNFIIIAPTVMIGDGVTDMQAKPPAELFIGFGGVVVRQSVKEEADWFVTDFKDIVTALNS